ncbi:hypothetical protein DMA11_22120 [Marinilabiliaceae bacterium JC017]|nr:hypothetical protein DMA11_22120 [Marinilabiliaceae bacterium JC017]
MAGFTFSIYWYAIGILKEVGYNKRLYKSIKQNELGELIFGQRPGAAKLVDLGNGDDTMEKSKDNIEYTPFALTQSYEHSRL